MLALGSILSASGLLDLVTFCQPLAAGLGAFALFSYVFVYTPLKERTPLSTLIGAVPGAVPPMIGCAAACGNLDRVALVLFLIVFLWQVPHFLAIAWIYRDQYARAGFLVLPVVDLQGVQTGKQMVHYTLVLVLASLMPCVLGIGGWFSGIGALIFGAAFFYRAFIFARTPPPTSCAGYSGCPCCSSRLCSCSWGWTPSGMQRAISARPATMASSTRSN